MSITSEEVFIHALSHDIRRKILQLLNIETRSFSQLLDFFDLSNGKLNYHLTQLSGFVKKTPTQSYEITLLGKKAIEILSEIQSLSETDPPSMKEAFVAQKQFKHPLFRQTMTIWIGVTIFMLILTIATSILLILFIPHLPWYVFLIEIVIIIGAIIFLVWLRQLKKSGDKMLDHIDQLLKSENGRKNK